MSNNGTQQNYYDTQISTTVKSNITKKSHRISKRRGVPYITYNRKTRVLFANPIGGAYINLDGSRIYFL